MKVGWVVLLVPYAVLVLKFNVGREGSRFDVKFKVMRGRGASTTEGVLRVERRTVVEGASETADETLLAALVERLVVDMADG